MHRMCCIASALRTKMACEAHTALLSTIEHTLSMHTMVGTAAHLRDHIIVLDNVDGPVTQPRSSLGLVGNDVPAPNGAILSLAFSQATGQQSNWHHRWSRCQLPLQSSSHATHLNYSVLSAGRAEMPCHC